MTARIKYTVVIVPDAAHGYIAYVPAVRGAVVSGASLGRVLVKLRACLGRELSSLHERGETIPPDKDAPPWPKQLAGVRIRRMLVEVP